MIFHGVTFFTISDEGRLMSTPVPVPLVPPDPPAVAPPLFNGGG